MFGYYAIAIALVVISRCDSAFYGDPLPDLADVDQNFRVERMNDWQQRKSAKEVDNWPKKETLDRLGQVSGVATSRDNNVHVFHRVDRVWDQRTFNLYNIYNNKNGPPIANDTVLVLDPNDGKVMKSWGANRFYVPHGISVDPQGNVWLTDVALHQVFRFKSDQLAEPDLVLGERFVPGNDDKHFCKPTDVAISSSGMIYISDGYCNSRIMMFSPEGHFVGQFGTNDQMLVPHSLTLLETDDLICVADRENRRILCYTAGLNGEKSAGKLVFNVQHKQLGRVFAIDHIGDILLAVNGPDMNSVPPKGLSLDLATEQLVDVWEPTTGHLEEPHDLAVSADSTSFFVGQISIKSQKKIFKFTIL
ncbi:peptidyl-alpha-hydroxyglycine alpha-amidating lyase 2-like [Oppia nitens]|uniref:peptidyl-alpha-hydroxyglycine alpha-amidating lyase 2-like n=1 Tax=Oppia nitens TaxID=1686743 RepID=UPI0023DC8107|nr:peptidyl-alpha-hydroxyglycine alpha-amidating lyase 2-like [Oppia nitens]